jgi:hypothetical protein
MRRAAVVALALAGVAAGCSSSSHVATPTIQAARTFALIGFQPAAPVAPGRPVTVAFTIQQPSGSPLTQYRKGAGPHTGVHLIIVRDDLSAIIHQHPPIGPDGHIVAHVTFPSPGRYRVLVDAYPASAGPLPNFQLFQNIVVKGSATTHPIPPFRPVEVVDGYRVAVKGKPRLSALQASFLDVTVTGPDGKPAHFTPWFGAVAHAIFFRSGSLAYFHTHVCGPTTPACAGAFGATRISGTSTAPGRLHVGVLLPQNGTWRLFLQFKVGGRILTAPFTLAVR